MTAASPAERPPQRARKPFKPWRRDYSTPSPRMSTFVVRVSSSTARSARTTGRGTMIETRCDLLCISQPEHITPRCHGGDYPRAAPSPPVRSSPLVAPNASCSRAHEVQCARVFPSHLLHSATRVPVLSPLFFIFICQKKTKKQRRVGVARSGACSPASRRKVLERGSRRTATSRSGRELEAITSKK